MPLVRRSLLVVVVGMLCVCGCRDGRLGYVRGQVVLNGKPLPDAMVEFQSSAGRVAYGRTNREGRFELKATVNEAGLEPGKYTVRISTDWYDTSPDGAPIHVPERVPARYHEQTELQRDVLPGTQTIDFALVGE